MVEIGFFMFPIRGDSVGDEVVFFDRISVEKRESASGLGPVGSFRAPKSQLQADLWASSSVDQIGHIARGVLSTLD